MLAEIGKGQQVPDCQQSTQSWQWWLLQPCHQERQAPFYRTARQADLWKAGGCWLCGFTAVAGVFVVGACESARISSHSLAQQPAGAIAALVHILNLGKWAPGMVLCCSYPVLRSLWTPREFEQCLCTISRRLSLPVCRQEGQWAVL